MREKNQQRILLVDDDAVVRAMYRDYLRKDGYAVVVVGSAFDAIERLREEKFDLVITDIMMARMDGWELIEAIRRDLGFEKEVLPIIVITAFQEDGMETKAWRKGAAAVYLKGRQPLASLLHEVRLHTGRVRSKFDAD